MEDLHLVLRILLVQEESEKKREQKLFIKKCNKILKEEMCNNFTKITEDFCFLFI
jgi:hypothetical protein